VGALAAALTRDQEGGNARFQPNRQQRCDGRCEPVEDNGVAACARPEDHAYQDGELRTSGDSQRRPRVYRTAVRLR